MSQENIPLSGRLWIKMIMALACLPLLGSVIDFAGADVQAGFGRINNMSVLVCFFFFAIFAANLKYLRGSGDRAVLLLGMAMAITIFARTTFDPATNVYGVVGSLVVLFVICSGYAAYAVGLRGVAVEKYLIWVCFLIAVSIPLAPIMVSLRPDAFKPYYLNVYGYSNVRVLGLFASMALVACILMLPALLSRVKSTPELLAASVLALAGVWSILFWSGSRAGMLSSIVAILLSWIVISWPGIRAVLMTIGTGALGACLSLFYYIPDNAFGLVDRVAKTTSGIADGDVSKLTSSRTDLWMWAVDRILEAPLIGRGLYAMSNMRPEEFNLYHTHNVVLEYAFGMGIPFALVALGLVLTLLFKAGSVARRGKDPYVVAAFGVVIALAGLAQMTAALFFPFTSMMFLMGIAAVLAWGRRSAASAPGAVGTGVDVGE